MSIRPGGRARLGGCLLVLAALGLGTPGLAGCAAGSSGDTGTHARPAASGGSSAGSSGSTTTVAAGNDPAAYSGLVLKYSRTAGIHPQVLMAILYNEAYKPHDPALQRAWLEVNPNAALGVANMHRAAFDDARRGRDFARRDWQDLIDDPALAVEAAAWYLHDLSAQLPRHWRGRLTRDELIALGYNTGAGNMRAFAAGVRLGPQARSYLDELHQNWSAAAAALAHHS